MSVNAGVGVGAALNSKAHCCLAPSIWRRLLMQAFCWAVVRARTKLGMAIAANRPIMATTIMISTSVKPDLRVFLIFIRLLFLLRRERSNGRVNLLSLHCVHNIARCDTAVVDQAVTMPEVWLSK